MTPAECGVIKMGLPPAAAQHAGSVYGNQVHVKYGKVTLNHMPTVGLFLMCAMLFN